MFVKNINPCFCKIEINFEPGIIPDFDESGQNNDFTWISVVDQSAYQTYLDQLHMDVNQIDFQIHVNQHEIYKDSPKTVQQVISQSHVQDMTEHQQHVLRFELSGFQESHMPLIDSETSIRAAIRLISLKIENVDITPIFNYFADFFDGTVHSTGGVIFSANTVSTLNFSTPIYKWLILNEQMVTEKKYLASNFKVQQVHNVCAEKSATK
jgi:hypothetical protein